MKKILSPKLEEKLTQYKPTEKISNLYCKQCGRYYTLCKYKSGYEFKDGCECEMIAAGKQAEKQRKQKAINHIFNQSNVNNSLKNATVNNYHPQNQTQQEAKQTSIEFVKTFSTNNPKSIIFQGSYGTGKTHLAYAIAKAVKSKGYSVAFMHIPKLMDRIKATYSKNAKESTEELVHLLSSIDLLVLDDIGVEDTEHTLNKLFSIVDNRVGMNNIFTTNLSNKDLNKDINWQRINSRMKQNARRVKVLGEDYRGTETW